MNCLSPDQIARQALGWEDDAGCVAHAQQCAECGARLAQARSLSARLGAMHAQFERGHDAARGQLMTALSAIDRPKPARSSSGTTRSGITRWLGGLSMRQRIAAGSFGVAAVLVSFWLWSGSAVKHVSAMERMAEEIRRAKSYRATSVFETDLPGRPGKLSLKAVLTSKDYWLAPGSYRSEMKGDKTSGNKDELAIHPAGMPGIYIDHKMKQFYRLPVQGGYVSPLAKFDELARFSGQADRDLGIRLFDGRPARGFEIGVRKIEPGGGPGLMQVWIDDDTNLPVLFRMDIELQGMHCSDTMRDFQWNIELDPKLFDLTPPEGYTDTSKPPPSAAEQVHAIAEGLRLYAELSGGHYPRGKMVYGDVTLDEMLKMSGISGQPTEEQRRGEAYQKIERIFDFFPTINGILENNPDAAYCGETVGPKDSAKILLRWRIDDGRYQVIYGDLRAEILTAQRLRALEAK